jgi:hypothetical protein
MGPCRQSADGKGREGKRGKRVEEREQGGNRNGKFRDEQRVARTEQKGCLVSLSLSHLAPFPARPDASHELGRERKRIGEEGWRLLRSRGYEKDWRQEKTLERGLENNAPGAYPPASSPFRFLYSVKAARELAERERLGRDWRGGE